MSDMTPKQAVQTLVHAGWSEARIAKEIGTSQPTIHRIKRGHDRAAYQTVKSLLALVERVVPADKPAANQESSHAA